MMLPSGIESCRLNNNNEYAKIFSLSKRRKLADDDDDEIFRKSLNFIKESDQIGGGKIRVKKLQDANISGYSNVFTVDSQSHPQCVIQSVRFHPSKNIMLTAGLDKNLRLFNVRSSHFQIDQHRLMVRRMKSLFPSISRTCLFFVQIGQIMEMKSFLVARDTRFTFMMLILKRQRTSARLRVCSRSGRSILQIVQMPITIILLHLHRQLNLLCQVKRVECTCWIVVQA